jgi:hypothetical protein
MFDFCTTFAKFHFYSAKVMNKSAAPVRMAGSEFFSDRTPQLAERLQRTLLFVVECQNSSFLADRNKHSERIQPISPAESTKLDVPSLTCHSNVGVGKYGNDRQTGRLVFSYATISCLCSRMDVLEGRSNTLDEDALRCAKSPVQPPLDSKDADAAHHPSVASQHLTGTSAGTGSSNLYIK